MLRKNPDDRPTAQQVLDFPPIAKYVQEIKEDPRFEDDYSEENMLPYQKYDSTFKKHNFEDI
jgi:hypothetical protein